MTNRTYIFVPLVGVIATLYGVNASATTVSAVLGKAPWFGGITRVEANRGVASDSYSRDEITMFASASDSGSVAASITANATGTTFHRSSATARIGYTVSGGSGRVPLSFNFGLTGSLSATKDFSNPFSFSHARVDWTAGTLRGATTSGESGIRCIVLCEPFGDGAAGASALVKAKIYGEFGEFDLEDLVDPSDPIVSEILDEFEFSVPNEIELFEERTSVLEANILGIASAFMPSIGVDDIAEISIGFEPTFVLDRTISAAVFSDRRNDTLFLRLATTARATSDGAFGSAQFGSTLLLESITAPAEYREAIEGMQVVLESGTTFDVRVGPSAAVVPLPASMWFLSSSVLMIVGMRRIRR